MTRLITLCLLLPGCAAERGTFWIAAAFATLAVAVLWLIARAVRSIDDPTENETGGVVVFALLFALLLLCAACSPARAPSLPVYPHGASLPMCESGWRPVDGGHVCDPARPYSQTWVVVPGPTPTPVLLPG